MDRNWFGWEMIGWELIWVGFDSGWKRSGGIWFGWELIGLELIGWDLIWVGFDLGGIDRVGIDSGGIWFGWEMIGWEMIGWDLIWVGIDWVGIVRGLELNGSRLKNCWNLNKHNLGCIWFKIKQVYLFIIARIINKHLPIKKIN